VFVVLLAASSGFVVVVVVPPVIIYEKDCPLDAALLLASLERIDMGGCSLYSSLVI
jgi:hypothetical protein